MAMADREAQRQTAALDKIARSVNEISRILETLNRNFVDFAQGSALKASKPDGRLALSDIEENIEDKLVNHDDDPKVTFANCKEEDLPGEPFVYGSHAFVYSHSYKKYGRPLEMDSNKSIFVEFLDGSAKVWIYLGDLRGLHNAPE